MVTPNAPFAAQNKPYYLETGNWLLVSKYYIIWNIVFQGAKNLYTNEQIISEFMKNPITSSDPTKRVVLIFHCEFSSERGPKMSRFLRKSDRQDNRDCYPNLHYPELYLLDGGYKVYYETEKVKRETG